MKQPTHVYILASYGESGLQEKVATIDRASVPVLLQRFIEGGYSAEDRATAVDRLAQALQDSDEELATDSVNLMNGWGGVQLYVIPLT